MSTTVADFVLQRLREWDVDLVFGYAGDGINGLLSAWEKADNRPRFVQARHEEMAAFEAVGYAKFTGRVGVCTATSGPGAIHLLNGLYDAKLDHVPVVAIVGQTARSAMGGNYQQEVDLHTLYKDVASEYCETVMVPEQLPNVLDRALRIAATRRTVTALIIPSDLQELEYTAPSHAFKMVPSSTDLSWSAPVPAAEQVQRAAEILNAGEKVAILVGQGARGAVDEVTQIAELTGAGVAKALLGKDVLPDELPWVTGSIGLLGTRPSYELMMDCDTLLVIGSNFPYTQFLPAFDQARAIQIDVDPTMIGMRYPFEVNLVGDAGATLPSDAILAADSGSAANWYARHIRIRGEMRGSLSGTLATMGPGVPYVIGAKFGVPDRPCYALVGDGAMQMNGLNELITIAKYWQEWADPRLVVAVLHNNDLNQVTWELRAMGGSPQFLPSQELPDFPYAGYARLLGLHGVTAEKPEEVVPAWEEALRADRPCVVEFRTDPSVPPIPPHASWDQIEKALESIVRGDSDRMGVIKEGVKSKVQEFLPGSKDEPDS